MESSDLVKINEIITKSQSNVEHLEEILETKKHSYNKPTYEYILCQIDYFNLIIFYNKRLLEIQEKLSLEYVKIMQMTLLKIKNKLDYILSDHFQKKTVEYEYERSQSIFRTQTSYYDEQMLVFDSLHDNFMMV
jgi:hypothetical protein